MAEKPPLTVPQLIAGMLASRSNSRELIEEADLLAQHGRHARAYSLLHTACEELGKFAIFEIAAGQVARGQPPDWKRFWARLRSHNSKSAQLELQLSMLNAFTIPADHFTALARQMFGRGLTFRNAAFYVEVGPDGNFRAPAEISFDVPLPAIRALATAALKAAEQRGDQEAIENKVQAGPSERHHARARVALVHALIEARDFGIWLEDLRAKINKKFRG